MKSTKRISAYTIENKIEIILHTNMIDSKRCKKSQKAAENRESHKVLPSILVPLDILGKKNRQIASFIENSSKRTTKSCIRGCNKSSE